MGSAASSVTTSRQSSAYSREPLPGAGSGECPNPGRSSDAYENPRSAGTQVGAAPAPAVQADHLRRCVPRPLDEDEPRGRGLQHGLRLRGAEWERRNAARG